MKSMTAEGERVLIISNEGRPVRSAGGMCFKTEFDIERHSFVYRRLLS